MKKLITGVLLASVAGSVFAVPVTIDTDDYAIGTNISRVDSNTWIHSVTYNYQTGFSYGDIFVDDAPTTDIFREEAWDSVAGGFGDHAFSRAISNTFPSTGFNQVHFYDLAKEGEIDNLPEIHGLGFRFLEPVQYLELKSLAGWDSAYVWAYDVAGNLLASIRQSAMTSDRPGGWYLQDLTFSRNQADIAYIVFGGGGVPSRLNQITYDVPAPASLLLFGIGLVGLGLRRKYSD